MINPWEKPPENKKEEAMSKEKNIDAIKKEIERRTGKKLPGNEEEFFRNFDELVPKEIEHIDFKESGWHVGVKEKSDGSLDYSQAAGFSPSRKISREKIRVELEKTLYGVTMQDVDDFFRNELEATEKELGDTRRSIDLGYKKDFDPKLLARHDKYVDLFNQIGAGSLGNPLAEIELKISDNFTSESEKENFRKFAERLSAEISKDRPKIDVNVIDIKKQIEKEAAYFSGAEDENTKKDNVEHFKKVLESLDKGDLRLASKEIEFSIGWIQERLEERKNKDLKKVSEEMLKKRFGENFIPVANKELEKLRSYRKFLKSGESKNV